jgi:hypothetical protein
MYYRFSEDVSINDIINSMIGYIDADIRFFSSNEDLRKDDVVKLRDGILFYEEPSSYTRFRITRSWNDRVYSIHVTGKDGTVKSVSILSE